MTIARSGSFFVMAMCLVCAAPFAACGGGGGAGGGGSKLPAGAHSEAIDHEACDESGHRVEAVDENNDNKPDIRNVYDKGSNVLLCRIVDLNHDQKPDMFEYYDPNGQIRRREYCFGDDGVVNAIEEYQNGKLVRRSYDTTGQHKIDTWDTFSPDSPVDAKTGRPTPVHRERDTTGDGRVDQWWDWSPDGTITIASDKTGSGKPDPATKLIIEAGTGTGGQAGDDGGVPTATATAPPPDTDAGAGPAAVVGDGGAK